MSTSGTYSNFAVSRDQIITLSLKLIRKLDEIETPSPQDITDCALLLNMIIKQQQGKTNFMPGLKTWTRVHGHLFLSSTTGQYTAGPAGVGWCTSYVGTTLSATTANGSVIPVVSVAGVSVGDNFAVQLSNGNLYWSTVKSILGLNVTINGTLPAQANYGAVVYDYPITAQGQQPIVVETASLRDINNEDAPLKLLTLQEYDWLPSKTDLTSVSDPVAIYTEFMLGNSAIYTDCAGAQDVTKHIIVTYMTAVQDFNNPTDNPFYPQEYYLFLAWELAKNAAPLYGCMFTPTMEEKRREAFANAGQKEPDKCVLYFQCDES